MRCARRSGYGLVASALVALVGCGGPMEPPVQPPAAPPSLAIVAGDGQQITAGDTLPIRPVVRAFDRNGPRAGQHVTFEASVQSGVWARVGEVQTDAQGLASIKWVPHTLAGSYMLVARLVEGASVTLHASVAHGPARQISHTCCGADFATVGALLTGDPQVVVLDGYTNRVPGQTVRFEVASGGGTITGAVQITDGDGVAALDGWALGATAPVNTIAVHVDGVPTRVITKYGAPDSIAIVAGDSQTVNVGSFVKVRPTVRLFGPAGNPLGAGFRVIFDGQGHGHDQVAVGDALTDATGTAQATSWRLGRDTGRYEMNGRSFDRAAVFTAFARPAAWAQIIPIQGDGRVGAAGNLLAFRPAYRLIDAAGEPIGYQKVVFIHPEGGRITAATETDGDGIGLITSWRLAAAVGSQTLRAMDGARELGRFTASAMPVPPSTFDIAIRFADDRLSDFHRNFFNDAAARWSTVIRGDLPDLPVALPADDECFPGLDETIDDLLIHVVGDSIDGEGGILAGAAPCVIRSGSLLPAAGIIIVDLADLSTLSTYQLGRLALHEIAHTLGFGALWQGFGLLLLDPDLGPRFTGAAAAVALTEAADALYTYPTSVPVEAGGGPGTALSHWAADAFGGELMTGFLGDAEPLSVVTIGAMRDLGYVVDDTGADPFRPQIQFLRATPARPLRELRVPVSIRIADAGGRIQRSLPPR